MKRVCVCVCIYAQQQKDAKTEVKSGLSVQISRLLSLLEESSRCTNMPASSCVIVHEKSPGQSADALVAAQSDSAAVKEMIHPQDS